MKRVNKGEPLPEIIVPRDELCYSIEELLMVLAPLKLIGIVLAGDYILGITEERQLRLTFGVKHISKPIFIDSQAISDIKTACEEFVGFPNENHFVLYDREDNNH